MDREAYFKALGQELAALKGRVRDLMDDPHWLTDGEWKESVLRSVLRRHLPPTALVGRGFVISEGFASHQLDVLIHDASRPVLHKDGDLVFVTPDAVLGIIEVKSRVTREKHKEALEKLCSDIAAIRGHAPGRAFAGFFAFESRIHDVDTILVDTAAAATTQKALLDFGAYGGSAFLRYWNLDPLTETEFYHRWHAYKLPGMAAGYFIHNVIEAICPQSVSKNPEVWFPVEGKEPRKVGSVAARWAKHS